MSERDPDLDCRPNLEISDNLVVQAQGGNEDAIVSVWTGVRPIVEHTVRRLVPDPSAAEEFAAAALERVITKGVYEQSFTGGNFAAWATVVTRNATLSALSKKHREPNVDPTILAAITEQEPSVSTGDSEMTIDTAERIAATLEAAGVTGKRRQALILLYVYGMPVRAIAETLGIKPGTVLSGTHRAKEAILKHYGAAPRDIFSGPDEDQMDIAA